ncbi:amino acid ABC transporter permease [Dongia sp.]|uniref:amino acid ABC transporter permease n=1 Tax=Dongia sp. TaxID=1977262 RepID=UPI0037518C51
MINAPHSVLGLLEPLALALVNTVLISAGAFVVAVVLGLALASLRHLTGARALRLGIQVYVEIFRNVPSLTHLFILYYGLAYAGLRLGSMTAAILGLGLIGSASLSEVFRAGLQSVPLGQVEAGLAQGMNPLKAFRLIVLPQAWRVALPPIGNYGVQLIKDTSLVAAIGAPEIMFTARNLVVNSFETTLVYVLTAALYVAICMPLILLIQGVERRLAVSR